MMHNVVGYFRDERERLQNELVRAKAREIPDHTGIALLGRLQAIVDDQLAGWQRELSEERKAA